MTNTVSGDLPSWVSALFERLDASDVEGWLGYLTDDARFRYGSQPLLQGKPAVREMVEGFLGSVRGLQHRVLAHWDAPGTLICQGEVTYQRHDGGELTVPFINVFGVEGQQIHEYLVYVDPTPLFSA